jgi:hypothetical protein
MISSCKKDSNSPSNTANATLDGKSYSFSDMLWENMSTYYDVDTYGGDETVPNLRIRLSAKKVGSIAISSTNYCEITIGSDVYKTVSGTITTTAFDDKNINGSFTGKCTKNGVITKTYEVSGSFNSNKLTLE